MSNQTDANCPDCDGKGYFPLPRIGFRPNGQYVEYCETCDGTGLVQPTVKLFDPNPE